MSDLEVTPLNAALQEIRKRIPVGLDEVKSYQVKNEKGEFESKSLSYANSHEFVITLPAWVLRALK